jgi:hypothetical protein
VNAMLGMGIRFVLTHNQPFMALDHTLWYKQKSNSTLVSFFFMVECPYFANQRRKADPRTLPGSVLLVRRPGLLLSLFVQCSSNSSRLLAKLRFLACSFLESSSYDSSRPDIPLNY